MKNLIFKGLGFGMILTLFVSCISVQRSNMDFVTAQNSSNSEMVAVNLPTALAKPFIIKGLKKDKESKDVIKVFKGIKKVKILTITKADKIIDEDFKYFMSKNNFQELMKVNSEGNKISINGKYNKEMIERLLLEIKSSENEVVYIDLKGKFKFEDIAKAMEK